MKLINIVIHCSTTYIVICIFVDLNMLNMNFTVELRCKFLIKDILYIQWRYALCSSSDIHLYKCSNLLWKVHHHFPPFSLPYFLAWIGIIRLRISFVIIPICSTSLLISSTVLMSSKSDTSLTFNICKYITIKDRHTMIMRLSRKLHKTVIGLFTIYIMIHILSQISHWINDVFPFKQPQCCNSVFTANAEDHEFDPRSG